MNRVAESVERAILAKTDPRGRYSSSGSISRELGKAFQRVLKQARNVDFSEILRGIRQRMLESLFEILHIHDPGAVSYLEPLLSILESQDSLTIATLNYDRSVETAAESAGLACETGLETWLTTGALALSHDGLRLLKLHGSIDWGIDEDQSSRGTLPLTSIVKLEVLTATQRQSVIPAVVFGEAGKLRAEGPYLELLLAWANELRETDVLLVVGYSFRDRHINEIIARWFRRSTGRMVIVDVHPPQLPRRPDEAPTFGQARTLADLERVFFIEGTAAERLVDAVGRATAV
jgi:hypothetical protein